MEVRHLADGLQFVELCGRYIGRMQLHGEFRGDRVGQGRVGSDSEATGSDMVTTVNYHSSGSL